MGRLTPRVREALVRELKHLNMPLSEFFTSKNKTVEVFLRYADDVKDDPEIQELIKQKELGNIKSIPNWVLSIKGVETTVDINATIDVNYNDPEPNFSGVPTMDLSDLEIVTESDSLIVTPGKLTEEQIRRSKRETMADPNSQMLIIQDDSYVEGLVKDVSKLHKSHKNKFVGDYKPISKLGQGGMGVVYKVQKQKDLEGRNRPFRIREDWQHLFQFLRAQQKQKARMRGRDESAISDRYMTPEGRKNLSEGFVKKWKRYFEEFKEFHGVSDDSTIDYNFAMKLTSINRDTKSSGNLERAIREAEIGLSFEHENIVSFLGAGIAEDKHPGQDDMFYILMEPLVESIEKNYVTNNSDVAEYDVDLGDELRYTHDIDDPQDLLLNAVRQWLDALHGLHYLHKHKGIVHRDIKLENMMTGMSGKVKLTDFGLLKRLDRKDESLGLTQDGTIAGSLTYMSPNIVEGNTKDATELDDIYAMAICGYELISGMHPDSELEFFTGDDLMKKLGRIKAGEPTILLTERHKIEEKRIRELEEQLDNQWTGKRKLSKAEKIKLTNELGMRKLRLDKFINRGVLYEIDQTLEWIVDKGLRKDEADRYQSVEQLIVDLEAWYEDYTKQRIKRDLPAEQSAGLSSTGTSAETVMLQVTNEMRKDRYYQRGGKKGFFERNAEKIKKGLLIGGLAGLVGIGGLFIASKDSDADLAYQSLTESIAAMEDDFGKGNYDSAFETFNVLVETAENNRNLDERFIATLKDLEKARSRIYENYVKDKINDVVADGDALREKGFAIDAERKFAEAIDLALNIDGKRKFKKHRQTIYDLINSIQSKVDENKRNCIEELVSQKDLNKQELLDRLIPYKLESLLTLDVKKYPQHVDDGKWFSKSSKNGSDLGSSVSLMLNCYNTTGDKRFLSKAIEWGNGMLSSFDTDPTAEFGTSYIDLVKLFEATGEDRYKDAVLGAADKILEKFEKKKDVEFLVNAHRGEISGFALDDSLLLYHAFKISGKQEYIEKFKANLDSFIGFAKKINGSVYARVKIDNDGAAIKRVGSDNHSPREAVRTEVMANVIDVYSTAHELFKEDKYFRTARNALDHMIDNVENLEVMWELQGKNINTIAGVKLAKAAKKFAKISGNKRYADYSEKLIKHIARNHLNLEDTAGLIEHGCLRPDYKKDTSFINTDAMFIDELIESRDDKEYNGEWRADLLEEKTGKLAYENSTKFKITVHDGKLNFTADCKSDIDPSKMPSGIDSKVWEGDAAGLRIYADGSFFEILVGRNGSLYDSRGTAMKGWDSYAQVKLDDYGRGYLTSFTIPLDLLNIEGDIKFNVIRAKNGKFDSFAYQVKDPHNVKRGEIISDDDIKYAILKR